MRPQTFSLPCETAARLKEAIALFPHRHILVVGDLMLDTFIWGDVRRISPEAPVPVVDVREETQFLGGTANVVNNVSSMGGQALTAGVIGDDQAGCRLAELLNRIGVSSGGLVVEKDRPTTLKTRIIARNQQVVRFDRESRAPLQKPSLERILAYIGENLTRLDGIIVSDYAKGMISADFMDGLRSLAEGSGVPILVDPKVRYPDIYHSVTMVTPNHDEAAMMSGMEIDDEASLVAAGTALLKRLGCKTLLITRGKDGMSIFQDGGLPTHIPTVARRVFDVTGAGDTVIAALALGIVSGLSPVEAALLANLAAGIVVGEVGTSAVSVEQLLAAIEDCRRGQW